MGNERIVLQSHWATLSYHSLHHQDSLLPQVGDKLVDVDGSLCPDPLQHVIQRDEGASPPHTSTAVHQESVLPGVGMTLPHSPGEVDHGEGIGWHAMIRPGQIVKLSHFKRWSVRLLILYIIGHYTWTRHVLCQNVHE